MLQKHKQLADKIKSLVVEHKATKVRIFEENNRSIDDFSVSYNKTTLQPVFNFEFKELEYNGETRLGMFKKNKHATKHIILPKETDIQATSSVIKKKKQHKTDPNKVLLALKYTVGKVYYVDGTHRYDDKN